MISPCSSLDLAHVRFAMTTIYPLQSPSCYIFRRRISRTPVRDADV
jgi:hypothetical protein